MKTITIIFPTHVRDLEQVVEPLLQRLLRPLLLPPGEVADLGLLADAAVPFAGVDVIPGNSGRGKCHRQKGL